MNRFFYDLDGSPLTGKTPVQVHVYGDGDHEAALNEAEGEIAVFLDAVRLSPASQHRRDSKLESGGSVRMNAVDDVITVEVFTEPRKVSGEPYYGGILVKLNVVPDEAKFRRDCMEDAPPGATLIRHDLKEVISHAKFSGASPTKPGRPAVPGTADEDAAEWLIIQIAPDKRIDDDPFNKEAVKIFRIADPKFGALTEYGAGAEFPLASSAEENKYIMSAEVSRSSDSNLALTKFFMCGQQIEDIPPLGVAPFSAVTMTNAGWAQTASLRAVDFIPDSFETAYAAGGIVIAALPHGLFALNTAEKTTTAPAQWKTLHAIQAGTNGYGAEFTDVTDALGVRTITCFGTSGAGLCNSYSVRIAPGLPGHPPTITGELAPRDTLVVPGTPGIATYSKNMSGTLSNKVSTPLPPLDTQIAYAYTIVDHSMTCVSVYRPATAARQADWYTGEFPLAEVPETLTYSALASAGGAFSYSMTSDSNTMAYYTDSTYPPGTFDATFPGTPDFETPIEDKRKREIGPMYSSKWRAGGFTPIGIHATDPFSSACTFRLPDGGVWHWTGLNSDYRIIRRDGTTLYHWGDIASKFPTVDPSLWGALTLPTTISGAPRGGEGSLPVEPKNSPRVLDGSAIQSVSPLFDPEPPEEDHSIYRYHFGGYPTLGKFDGGAWSDPPIPYYVYGDSTRTLWYHKLEPVTSWNFSAIYDPAAVPFVGSAADAAARFPSSGYRDGVAQRDWALGYGSDIAAEAALAHPMSETLFVSFGVIQGPYISGMWGRNSGGHPNAWMGPTPVDDRYIRDPRTGGFIAQMHWSADNPDNPSLWAESLMWYGYTMPRTYPISCEIIVGNELGAVPLAALLNEWMELGAKAGSFGSLPLSYDLVFIDDRGAQATMLI